MSLLISLNISLSSYGALVNGSGEDDASKIFIQALQLLLRMGPLLRYRTFSSLSHNFNAHSDVSGGGGTPNNTRSVFMPQGKQRDGAFELWRGIFQSVRPTINRLLVNVDTVAAFVYVSDVLRPKDPCI